MRRKGRFLQNVDGKLYLTITRAASFPMFPASSVNETIIYVGMDLTLSYFLKKSI